MKKQPKKTKVRTPPQVVSPRVLPEVVGGSGSGDGGDGGLTNAMNHNDALVRPRRR